MDANCDCSGNSCSHPNSIIWEYHAYDYAEVLVGYDKYPHPNDPPVDPGREPVFRYSVRIPQGDWFYQDEPNNVFWFGVVAVYENDPNYEWGWTNHKHVYNDDAVEGYPDWFGPEEDSMWYWAPLYDQTGMSEDMSFILFNGCPCWGDIVGSTSPAPDGIVNTADLGAMLGLLGPLFGSSPPYEVCPVPTGWECMDLAGSTSPAPDGCINTADLGAMLGYLGPLFGSTPAYQGPCMPAPPSGP